MSLDVRVEEYLSKNNLSYNMLVRMALEEFISVGADVSAGTGRLRAGKSHGLFAPRAEPGFRPARQLTPALVRPGRSLLRGIGGLLATRSFEGVDIQPHACAAPLFFL